MKTRMMTGNKKSKDPNKLIYGIIIICLLLMSSCSSNKKYEIITEDGRTTYLDHSSGNVWILTDNIEDGSFTGEKKWINLGAPHVNAPEVGDIYKVDITKNHN